jgi:hypothetical protein
MQDETLPGAPNIAFHGEPPHIACLIWRCHLFLALIQLRPIHPLVRQVILPRRFQARYTSAQLQEMLDQRPRQAYVYRQIKGMMQSFRILFSERSLILMQIRLLFPMSRQRFHWTACWRADFSSYICHPLTFRMMSCTGAVSKGKATTSSLPVELSNASHSICQHCKMSWSAQLDVLRIRFAVCFIYLTSALVGS